MATKLNSMMKNIHLATGPTPDLKTKHIENLEGPELANILNQTAFLQGYPTHNTACLPIIELTNYYVDARIIAAYHISGKDYSICSATLEVQANSAKKLGEVGYILEYMTINKGAECIVEGYEHIRALGEKTFTVFEEVTPLINLYCLYGQDNAAHNAIHDVL